MTAIPSHLPTKPSPSVVVAFTFMRLWLKSVSYTHLSLCDIDLAKNLVDSEICSFFYTQANKTNTKICDNVGINIKMKNQILVSITDSLDVYKRQR